MKNPEKPDPPLGGCFTLMLLPAALAFLLGVAPNGTAGRLESELTIAAYVLDLAVFVSAFVMAWTTPANRGASAIMALIIAAQLFVTVGMTFAVFGMGMSLMLGLGLPFTILALAASGFFVWRMGWWLPVLTEAAALFNALVMLMLFAKYNA